MGSSRCLSFSYLHAINPLNLSAVFVNRGSRSGGHGARCTLKRRASALKFATSLTGRQLFFLSIISSVTLISKLRKRSRLELYSDLRDTVNLPHGLCADEECDHFRPLFGDDCNFKPGDACEATGWEAGRLGNRLLSISHMFVQAHLSGCHVKLPGQPLLENWPSNVCGFMNINFANTLQRTDRCPRLSAGEWHRLFRGRKDIAAVSTVAVKMMQVYFRVNETHALDKPCSVDKYFVIHLRAGDVTDGYFSSETGHFIPEKNINKEYGLSPTAFYVQLLKLEAFDTIFVICETPGNPTCEFFIQLSEISKRIHVRLGKPLLDDVHYMLCADTAAVSKGSFQRLLEISVKKRMVHTFVPLPVINCPELKTDVTFHYIQTLENRRKYVTDVLARWQNNEYQRYLVSKPYKMTHLVCRGTSHTL